jgi:hypothetical protein
VANDSVPIGSLYFPKKRNPQSQQNRKENKKKTCSGLSNKRRKVTDSHMKHSFFLFGVVRREASQSNQFKKEMKNNTT